MNFWIHHDASTLDLRAKALLANAVDAILIQDGILGVLQTQIGRVIRTIAFYDREIDDRRGTQITLVVDGTWLSTLIRSR